MSEKTKVQAKTLAHSVSTPKSLAFQARPFAAQPESTFGEEHDGSSLFDTYLQRRAWAHDFGRAPPQMVIQPKLTLGPAGDKYEQEADLVAKQVMRQIHAPMSQPANQAQSVQRSYDELRRTPNIQRLPTVEGATVESGIESAITQAQGGGLPLAEGVRAPMEQAFAADFSGVRVHTDAESDSLNRSLQARAFTTGQDIFFRQGEYSPSSSGGQQLLAHELTHVVQQNGAKSVSPTIIQRFHVENKTNLEKFPATSTNLVYLQALLKEMQTALDDPDKEKWELPSYTIKKTRSDQKFDKKTLIQSTEQIIEARIRPQGQFSGIGRAAPDAMTGQDRPDAGKIDSNKPGIRPPSKEIKSSWPSNKNHQLDISYDNTHFKITSHLKHYTPWAEGGRNPQQTALMKSNAKTYIHHYVKANPTGQYEWLHLIANSLGGKNVYGNLVAGSFDANTEMIPYERAIASWASDLPAAPDGISAVEIKATADLQGDSWLATKITLEGQGPKPGQKVNAVINNPQRTKMLTVSDYKAIEASL